MNRSAQIIPFPARRRVHFIERHAETVATRTPGAAQRHVEMVLDSQREVMVGRGVAPELIRRELAALEAAIRRGIVDGGKAGGVA